MYISPNKNLYSNENDEMYQLDATNYDLLS